MSFLLKNSQGNVFVVNSDDQTVPYQRVEYLESTGTQYINTNYVVDENDAIYCDYELTDLAGSGDKFILGASGNNGTLWVENYQNYNRWYVRFGGTSSASSEFYLTETKGSFVVKKSLFTSPRSSLSLSYSSMPETPLVLFGRNRATSAPNVSPNRIYRVRIQVGETMKHDFIPVRVGSVGYMYDKVSGQLFGNAGTGDFVLGPDMPNKALSVERGPGYVTDGLIFWVDGIDKGASDGSWVDKIGGHTFLHTAQSPTSTSTGFYFDGTNGFYNNTFTTKTSPTTHTIEVVISNAQVSSNGYCIFTAYTSNASQQRFYVAFAGTLPGIVLSTPTSYPTLEYSTAADVKSIVSCPDGRCYINNSPAVIGSSQYYSCNGTANRIGYGYYNSKWRHEYIGNIHAIRIYNRSLTADEIAHNYALDMMRFKL